MTSRDRGPTEDEEIVTEMAPLVASAAKNRRLLRRTARRPYRKDPTTPFARDGPEPRIRSTGVRLAYSMVLRLSAAFHDHLRDLGGHQSGLDHQTGGELSGQR
jgi:hypothetical protein